jgi:hypothetical protein
MPTFDITAPDGKNYEVDGADHQGALAALQKHLGASTPPAAPMSAGEVAADVAKSGGIGLAKGGIGLAGMGGDLAEMAKKGADWVGGKLPSVPSPAPDSTLGRLSQFLRDESAKSANLPAAQGSGDLPGSYVPPTGAQIQKSVEGVTGDFYEPKTTMGQYAQTAGEFAPALIGGPETLAAKLASRVAAPALVSETAGQLTKGTAAEPWARVAGALLSPLATSAARRVITPLPARAVPSADEILSTAGKQFNQARDMNVIVKPDFATNAAADMRSAVKNYDPEVAAKPVLAAADRLENLGVSGPGLPPVAVQMNDTEHIRQQLVSLKTSPDGSVRSAANDAVKSLQRSQMALTSADTLSGDAAAYRNLVSDAVGNWAKGRQAQTVMGKIGNAELNSATAGSGANQDNNMRQGIKQLARNVNNTDLPVWKKMGMSDAAGALIDQAARGTIGGNIARGIGKGAPTGIVSAAGGMGLGHVFGGPVGMVALPAVGYIAKKIGDLSTNRAANAITSLILSESPLSRGNQAIGAVSQALFPPAVTRSSGANAVTAALLAHQGNPEPTRPQISPGVAKVLQGMRP